MSLKRNLVLLLLLPLVAVLAIATLVNYGQARSTLGEAFDHSLADDARSLATQVRPGRDGTIVVDLPAAAEAILRSDSVDEEFYAVWDASGILAFGDGDLAPGPGAPGGDVALADGFLRGKRIRRADYAFSVEGRDVRIVFAETTVKRDEAIRRVFASMMAPNVLLIATSMAVVYFGVGTGLSPLRRLGQSIARRGVDDTSSLSQNGIPEEAAPLVDAMNNLIKRLRSDVDAQRRFLEDAAHQLRTPLTGLQTQLELAMLEDQPAPLRERISRALEAAKRIDRANRQLLALGRSANRNVAGTAPEEIDLAVLVADAASGWFDLAERSGVALAFETAAAPVLGYPWLLSEMMTNIVENAIHHSGRGANVVIRCGSGPGDRGEAFFSVEDDGPGIAPADRGRIFERFYRGVGARGAGGSGLGLAIVDAGCRMHAGHIGIDAGTGGRGTTFRIAFPPPPRDDGPGPQA